MKKIISIILCLVLVCAASFLLVGCNNVNAEVSLYSDNLVSEVLHGKKAASYITDGALVEDVWIVKLREKRNVDTLILEEKTDSVTSFGVYGKDEDGAYSLIYKQNRIDEYRVCALEEMETDELRIEVYAKTAKVDIKNIQVYDSGIAKRTTSFRVVDFLQTTDNKLENNQNSPDFYNHLKGIDDLVMFGDISMDDTGNVVYNEGKDDFQKDVDILNEFKVKIANNTMKIVADVNIKSHIKEEKDSKANKAVRKWIKANMSAIVTNIVAMAEEFNLDGINLDWDYPNTGSEWSQYSKLIVELSNALAAKNKYLTLSVLPWACNLTKKARNAVEYVNLQAYDMYDDRGEHASQYETAKLSTETFLKKSKFAPEKVMLGLPFHGRTTNKSSQCFSIRELFKNNSDIDKWVNKMYNCIYEATGIKKYSDMYFNGYAMICDKTTYAIATGLGGVSISNLAYDVAASWELSLHNAVKQTVAKRVEVEQAQ